MPSKTFPSGWQATIQGGDLPPRPQVFRTPPYRVPPLRQVAFRLALRLARPQLRVELRPELLLLPRVVRWVRREIPPRRNLCC